MATDEEEALTALGAATIPQLPLSSEHYEFALTHNYAIEVRPPTAEAWHLVSVLTGFSRSTQSRTVFDPNGMSRSIEEQILNPVLVALWARRKK